MDSHFWDIVRDIRYLIQVSQCLRPFWFTGGASATLSDLADLVGIEPTASSMPWSGSKRKL
jgi:hypothetical protein